MIAREGILGRDNELGIVASLVAKATAGGGALLIHGDAGIGKSALLERAVVLAQAAGMRVLLATGVRTEANLPFAGLHQLLRPILAGLEALPKPQYAALGVAVHRPLARVPENGLKFIVGLMLTTFGTFWAGEGIGVEWIASDATILVLLVIYTIASLGAVMGVRHRSLRSPSVLATRPAKGT